MIRAIASVVAACLLAVICDVQGAHGFECRALPYVPKRNEAGKPAYRIYIFAFDGPGQFGLNVRWLFDVQMWSTLRRSDPLIPKSDFGTGLVDGCSQSLPDSSFQTADDVSKQLGAPVQVVLWGRASHFADGDVVEAYLSIPEQPAGSVDTSRNIWNIDFSEKGHSNKISLDVPTRHVTFRPIVLRNGVVQRLASSVTGKIYKDKTLQEVVSEPTDGWLVAKSYESDGIWLREPKGWLPIPTLSDEKSEVVIFSAAIVQTLRGDWGGAKVRFRTVLRDDSLPIDTRVNTLIFLGVAEEKLGESGRREFEEAARLNPLSRRAAAFLIMSALADFGVVDGRVPEGDSVKMDRLRALVDDKRSLFEPNDEWFQRVVRIEKLLSAGSAPVRH
jgi:hypothetical protein